MPVYVYVHGRLGILPAQALGRDPTAEAMRLYDLIGRLYPTVNRAHVAVEFHLKPFQVIEFGLYRPALALVAMCQSTLPLL
jgi:hypothetical protein